MITGFGNLICDNSTNFSSKSFSLSAFVLHKNINAPALAADKSNLTISSTVFLTLVKTKQNL